MSKVQLAYERHPLILGPIAMDARIGQLDNEEKDPQGTNRSGSDPLFMGELPGGHAAANKGQYSVTGGMLDDNYRPTAGDDEPDDEGIPEELIRELLRHADTNLGMGEQMLKNLHGRLTAGRQAGDVGSPFAGGMLEAPSQDAPSSFSGMPKVGGGKAMDAAAVRRGRQQAQKIKLAMDRMGRDERARFVKANRQLVRRVHAMDAAAQRSFAQRWPDAAKIKQCY
jgi:hypothetical protein